MTICLSAKELLCIAALLGVPEVIAIPDAFRNVAPGRLKEEIQDIQQSLEQKGFLSLDFDGNCTLTSAYLPYLETVLKGTKVIMVDAQLNSSGQANCVYYISERNIVRSFPKDGAFELCDISMVQAAEELCGRINWVHGEQLNCQPLLISQKQLNHIKAANSLEELRKSGADDGLSPVIADALLFKTNYYSFAFLDRRSGGRLINLIFIDDVRGSLKLTPTVENDQNYILIEAADQEQLKEALAEAVRDMLQAGEEG